MKAGLCWLAAVMTVMPVAAIAQPRMQPEIRDRLRTDSGRLSAVPLPPRRPAALPRPPPAEKASGSESPKPRPETATRDGDGKPAAAAASPTPAATGMPAPSAVPAPPPSLACTVGLAASHGDGVVAIEPAKLHAGLDAGCHVEEPVLVRRLTLRHDGASETLIFDPPATIACDLAASFARWAETGLQPLAKGHFDRRITRLRVGGGHECRRRNRSMAGPLSEHSTGRALDIFGFVLEGEAVAEPVKTGGTPSPRTTRPSDGAAGQLAISVEKPAGPPQLAFLEAVRQSACGAFTTVLGPGSDAAHANHLHLDIQARRSGASRFCQ